MSEKYVKFKITLEIESNDGEGARHSTISIDGKGAQLESRPSMEVVAIRMATLLAMIESAGVIIGSDWGDPPQAFLEEYEYHKGAERD